MLPYDDFGSSLLGREGFGTRVESFGKVCQFHDATRWDWRCRGSNKSIGNQCVAKPCGIEPVGDARIGMRNNDPKSTIGIDCELGAVSAACPSGDIK